MYQDKGRKLTDSDIRFSRRTGFKVVAGAGLGVLLAAAGARPEVAMAAPAEQAAGEPVIKLSEAPLNTFVTPRSASGEAWSRVGLVAILDNPSIQVIDRPELHRFSMVGRGPHSGFNMVLNPGEQEQFHGEGKYTTVKFDNLPEGAQVVVLDSQNLRQVVVDTGNARWAAFGVADSPIPLQFNFRVIGNTTSPIDVSLAPFSEADIKNPQFPVVKDLTGAFPEQTVVAPSAPTAVPAARHEVAAPQPVAPEAPKGLITLPRLRFEEATPGPGYFFALNRRGDPFNLSMVYEIPYREEGTKIYSDNEVGRIRFLTDSRARSFGVNIITNSELIDYNAMSSNGRVMPGDLPSAYVRTHRDSLVRLVDVYGRELGRAVVGDKGEVVIPLPRGYSAGFGIRTEIAHPTVSKENEIAFGPSTAEWRRQTVVLDANGVAPPAQFHFQ